MKLWMAALVLTGGLLGAPRLALAAPPSGPIRPAPQIRVALVPVVVATGEKDEKALAELAGRADDELRRLFAERGFSLIDASAVEKALTAASGPERARNEVERRVGLAEALGKTLGADWIVVVSLDAMEQRRIHAPITDASETLYLTALRCWIVGGGAGMPGGELVRSELRADTFEAGGSAPRRQREALAGALRASLRATFAPYPVKKD